MKPSSIACLIEYRWNGWGRPSAPSVPKRSRVTLRGVAVNPKVADVGLRTSLALILGDQVLNVLRACRFSRVSVSLSAWALLPDWLTHALRRPGSRICGPPGQR